MNSNSFVLQDYILEKSPIGIGSFSKVYKAKKDGKYYAIKKINIVNKKNEQKFHKEFELMRKLKHINIIKMHNIIIHDAFTFYLVLDYHERGDLSNILNGTPMHEKIAQNYAIQLKDGLEYLYEKKIIHRDLKPQNILISNENILKITDFGFARYVENPHTLINTMCGSPLYMAPEILSRNNYNIVSDLWSVGLIIYQMLIGYLPFSGKNLVDLFTNIKNKELTFPDHVNISTRSKELIKRLVVKDPLRRCNWEFFFTNKWLQMENSIIVKEENELLEIDIDTVPNLNNFNLNKSLSYVYKSQFDQELSFRDTFEASQELGSSTDSFVSAESDNYDDKNYDKNEVVIIKKKETTNSVSSDKDNAQSSFVFVDHEKHNEERDLSFKKNMKQYLYSSLNFVKEGYDYISQSNSL